MKQVPSFVQFYSLALFILDGPKSVADAATERTRDEHADERQYPGFGSGWFEQGILKGEVSLYH